MSSAHGFRLEDVDQWVGDRAHHGDRRGGKKSNTRLKASIAEVLGHDTRVRGWTDKLPKPLRFMKTPRKFSQSVWEGSVDPSCHGLIESLNEWNGSTSPTDPWKHAIDALRYIAVPMSEGVAH
jgi:hypothetical protein